MFNTGVAQAPGELLQNKKQQHCSPRPGGGAAARQERVKVVSMIWLGWWGSLRRFARCTPRGLPLRRGVAGVARPRRMLQLGPAPGRSRLPRRVPWGATTSSGWRSFSQRASSAAAAFKTGSPVRAQSWKSTWSTQGTWRCEHLEQLASTWSTWGTWRCEHLGHLASTWGTWSTWST